MLELPETMDTSLVDGNRNAKASEPSYGGVDDPKNTTPPSSSSTGSDQVRLWKVVYHISWTSFVFLVILGIASIVLGEIHDRAAVFAFGVSSTLDGICAGVVFWRSYSMRNGYLSSELSTNYELIADFLLGVIFIAASVFILVNSIEGLYAPFASADITLLVVSGIGGFSEIIFCVFKIRLGKKLKSMSVLADGINSLVCGLLGISVIPSEVIGHLTNNGSTDHILGILVAIFVFVYGIGLIVFVLSRPSTRMWIRPHTSRLCRKCGESSEESDSEGITLTS